MYVWFVAVAAPRVRMYVWFAAVAAPRVHMYVWFAAVAAPRVHMYVWFVAVAAPRVHMYVWIWPTLQLGKHAIHIEYSSGRILQWCEGWPGLDILYN
jgi:hypothetical protein